MDKYDPSNLCADWKQQVRLRGGESYVRSLADDARAFDKRRGVYGHPMR